MARPPSPVARRLRAIGAFPARDWPPRRSAVHPQTDLVQGGLAPSGEVGPYRLLRSLGNGGMAEVFLAQHRHLDQVRAVKVIRPEISRRPGLVDRLLIEARATARLHHPGIVNIFDCDTLPSGGAFITMEYLDGEPAARWLDRIGSLSRDPHLAAAMVGVVADALAHAHSQGVVHRDIKPDNLFLVPDPTDEGRFSIKVLDFGVAKLLREESVFSTQQGCVVGTPMYMAPEQWHAGAGAIDCRTDIYSLGCLFFELLAGRPPFAEGGGVEIMRAHLVETPPVIRALAPDVPAAIEELLVRMLAKSPENRPDTMADVLLALEAILGKSPAELGSMLRTPPAWPIRRGQVSTVEPTIPGVGPAGVRPAVVRPVGVGPAGVPGPTEIAVKSASRLSRTVLMSRTLLISRHSPRSVAAVVGAALLSIGAIAVLTVGADRPPEAAAPPAPPATALPAVAPAGLPAPAPATLPAPALPSRPPAPSQARPLAPAAGLHLPPARREAVQAMTPSERRTTKKPAGARRPARPASRRASNLYQPIGD
jgi:eukaryotic-like serine/threonine-protein kinase